MNYLDLFSNSFFSQKEMKTFGEEDYSNTSKITDDNSDGAIEVDNYSSQAISLYKQPENQAELINSYRDIANYSMVDYAIEDIVNECISFTEDEEPVTLDLSDIDKKEMSDAIKDKVYEKWEKICQLLELNDTIHRKMRNFYIDGRMAYQEVYNKNKLSEGIQQIIELDACLITKYKNIKYNEEAMTIEGVEEFFIYDESILNQKTKKKTDRKTTKGNRTFKLDPAHVTYVTSGMTDSETGYAISWLHKAIRPANHLMLMENSLIVYRITRAPERRIFYVYTGGMQPKKAFDYLNNLKNGYRNKMSFDPSSGSFKDQRHMMTMQEDIWLPRNSSGQGTEVDTLAGGDNLDQIADVLYFQKELYKALNVPLSRLDSESNVNFGRQSEISRDELKLSKMISKVRKRFNILFLTLLEKELILSKVITRKEWASVRHKIKFIYSQDLYIEELKKFDLYASRLELASNFQPHLGKYVSNDFIRKEILRQTETEIEEQDKLIKKEKTMSQYKDGEYDDGDVTNNFH